MPFEIPDNIHPDCARLAWILGRWAGNGRGAYPGIEEFAYGQEMVFQQDGRPFIHYFSRSWIVDEAGEPVAEFAQETGFLRPQPDGSLEVVLTHHTGIVEIYYGALHPDQPRFEVATDAVARTATAEDYAGSTRLYGYVNGDLLYAVDRAALGEPLQDYIHAQLVRQ